MSRRGLAVGAVAVLAVFVVSGCGTMPKKYKEELSGIKTKVDTLESRVETVESKQVEVEKTAAEQVQSIEELKAQKQQASSKSNVSIKSRSGSSHEKTKDIQRALKNAGLYDGKVDGVKGNQTKNAVKAFQKANGLKADGVVGPKTWDLLSKYASGGKGEGAE